MAGKGKGNTRAAFMSAGNAADAARTIGKNEKAFRTYLRKLGHYAQRGTGWSTMSTKERGDVFTHYVPDAPKPRAPRKAKVDATPEIAPE